ncbi:MAG TPA: Gfo/Idh/MocA family oxidoreductase [Kofleriaceae bacterium]|nr:Gfo/Idh/MocA family oxidoreductase [Kofleriaceae bacterium]
MAARRRPRIAVVGAGAWGRSHVRTFAAERGCELTWVCDPSTAALAAAADLAPHARPSERFDDVLTAADVDAVVLATPARLHAEQATRVLETGRAVLVEKPLALTVADAEAVARAAARSGAPLVVGHLMLYHPAVERLRELIDGGELGELFYLTSTRANLGRLRSDENALWSLGPHDLSMFDYLVRAPLATVTARGQSFLQPGIADVVFATLGFERASPPAGAGAAPVLAHVHLSWLSPRKERRLVVVGSRKMVEFDDTASDKLRLYDRGFDRPPEFASFAEYLTLRHGEVTIPALDMVEPLAAMARHFVDCVNGAARPRTDAAGGVRVVRMLAAAQASLEQVP